jgi:hypothetical protein
MEPPGDAGLAAWIHRGTRMAEFQPPSCVSPHWRARIARPRSQKIAIALHAMFILWVHSGGRACVLEVTGGAAIPSEWRTVLSFVGIK